MSGSISQPLQAGTSERQKMASGCRQRLTCFLKKRHGHTSSFPPSGLKWCTPCIFKLASGFALCASSATGVVSGDGKSAGGEA